MALGLEKAVQVTSVAQNGVIADRMMNIVAAGVKMISDTAKQVDHRPPKVKNHRQMVDVVENIPA